MEWGIVESAALGFFGVACLVVTIMKWRQDRLIAKYKQEDERLNAELKAKWDSLRRQKQ